MDDPRMLKCPLCGRVVLVPTNVARLSKSLSEERYRQTVQALCGCWVSRLPQPKVMRLVGAIMAGSEFYAD
jgi:hypothetical protein